MPPRNLNSTTSNAKEISDSFAKPRNFGRGEDNFWTYSPNEEAYDLRRGSSTRPPLRLGTSTKDVLLDPERTALVVVDMQNFFLHPAVRAHPEGLAAHDVLVKKAIPACRAAGIDVVFLNWGLTDEDLQALPASVQKAFARDTLSTGPPCALPKPKSAAPPSTITGALEEAGSACTTSSIVESPLYVGLGVDMGLLDVVDGSASARRNGRAKVDQGRMLLRDSWNADLYGELQRVWTDAQAEEGKEGQRKDKIKTFWCHKNRITGIWGPDETGTPFLRHLSERKPSTKTLLFAGVNTDQCVFGTLLSAFTYGYDVILLPDCCGTTSPSFATKMVVYNTEKLHGFVSDADRLAVAAGLAR